MKIIAFVRYLKATNFSEFGFTYLFDESLQLIVSLTSTC